MQQDAAFYKEQMQSKEDMLSRTTSFLLDAQHSLIEKNKEISDINASVFESIRFAELIQKSLLPDVEILRSRTGDAAYRVINQIGIGGDSVFIKNSEREILFGLLDSTGHGIPAAMLSISGILMFNELAATVDPDSPMAIMKLLNYRLNRTFNSGSSIAHMEGVVCSYSSAKQMLTYSSAKGKGFHLCATGEIKDLEFTRSAIGGDMQAEYRDFVIDVKKGDKLMLYSDGLTDQFGGEKDKKFTKLRLKELLVRCKEQNVNELSKSIESAHYHWKGETFQTDDISFMIVEF